MIAGAVSGSKTRGIFIIFLCFLKIRMDFLNISGFKEVKLIYTLVTKRLWSSAGIPSTGKQAGWVERISWLIRRKGSLLKKLPSLNLQLVGHFVLGRDFLHWVSFLLSLLSQYDSFSSKCSETLGPNLNYSLIIYLEISNKWKSSKIQLYQK